MASMFSDVPDPRKMRDMCDHMAHQVIEHRERVLHLEAQISKMRDSILHHGGATESLWREFKTLFPWAIEGPTLPSSPRRKYDFTEGLTKICDALGLDAARRGNVVVERSAAGFIVRRLEGE